MQIPIRLIIFFVCGCQCLFEIAHTGPAGGAIPLADCCEKCKSHVCERERLNACFFLSFHHIVLLEKIDWS